MSVKGLFDLGKAVAPKVVAGGLLGAAASDDAEAAPSALFKAGIQHPYAQLRKLVAKNKQNGISPEKTVTDWIHKNTNYEDLGKYGRATEGMSGDWYKGQIESIYEMLMDGIDPASADKDLLSGLDAWKMLRVGRDSSHVMPHTAAAATAATAAAGSGAANSAEGYTQLGPGFASGFGPQQEGSTPAANGLPSWDRYETGPSHGLPTPTWGDVGESLFSVLGAPMAGLQGLARGAYGLATGEDVVTAGAEAAHMMGSRHKGKGGIMTPGTDSAEGWKRYGDYTEDSFNKSGAVTPGIAKALGTINRLPEYIIPF
jgi:hypothetical protein